MKNFLDPFGIDVSYYVDAAKNKSAAAEETKKAESETTATNTDVKMEEEVKAEPAAAAAAAATSTTTTTTTASPSTSLPHVPLTRLVPATPFAMASEALQQVLRDQMAANEAAAAAASAAASAPAAEAKKENLNNSVETEFNMVDIEKELRVINGIEQMKLMGYTDDNGWLTRLVASKDGNLNNVLDALTPQGKKNN